MGRGSDERPLWWKLQLNPQSRLNPHILFNIETYLKFYFKMLEIIPMQKLFLCPRTRGCLRILSRGHSGKGHFNNIYLLYISLKKVLIWPKKKILGLKMSKNAEFHADFKSVGKVLKKFTNKKLAAKMWRKYTLFPLLLRFVKLVLLITFFGAFL